MTAASVLPHVVREQTGLHWRATVAGEDAGSLRVNVRPDGRCHASFRSCRRGVEAALVAAVDAELGCALHLTLAEDAVDALRVAAELGFRAARRESVYAIPTVPVATALPLAAPPGVALVRADRVDEDRLRLLDDALRQDVPGTSGWRWDPAAFHGETFDPDYFDAATYAVAVDEATGAYVGLARVWNNPGQPRLGLVGVLATHRRRGIARSLLGHVFAVLHERGAHEVTAEVDDANVPSTTLLTSIGARRIGGVLELFKDRAWGT